MLFLFLRVVNSVIFWYECLLNLCLLGIRLNNFYLVMFMFLNICRFIFCFIVVLFVKECKVSCFNLVFLFFELFFGLFLFFKNIFEKFIFCFEGL